MSKFSTDNRESAAALMIRSIRTAFRSLIRLRTAQRRMKRPSLERMSEQMRCPGLRRFYRKVWSESPSRR